MNRPACLPFQRLLEVQLFHWDPLVLAALEGQAYRYRRSHLVDQFCPVRRHYRWFPLGHRDPVCPCLLPVPLVPAGPDVNKPHKNLKHISTLSMECSAKCWLYLTVSRPQKRLHRMCWDQNWTENFSLETLAIFSIYLRQFITRWHYVVISLSPWRQYVRRACASICSPVNDGPKCYECLAMKMNITYYISFEYYFVIYIYVIFWLISHLHIFMFTLCFSK